MDSVQNLSIKIKKLSMDPVFEIYITDQTSIACCCFFNPTFALFLFLFISHYLKKESMDPVHESGPWTQSNCGSISWTQVHNRLKFDSHIFHSVVQ